MLFISEIFSFIGNIILAIISSLGYAGIFFLMILESMVFPVPSEFVMPFAGFLVFQGQFNFPIVVFFSSFGSICGSLLSYYIGKRWGYKLVTSYGKYFLVNAEDLKKTEVWFTKRGELTIFICRLLPIIRHLISLVAGVGKMDIKKFTIYTIIGATIWNTFLIYLGYLLGQYWDEVTKYSEEISIGVIILLFIGGIYYIIQHLKKKNKILKKENNSTL